MRFAQTLDYEFVGLAANIGVPQMLQRVATELGKPMQLLVRHLQGCASAPANGQ